ncbi:MAG: hypothetical protein L0H11_06865, partial [Brevibacterium aurantiacum]|nr:hypothetical protein [Janibacter sp.]MDN5738395.1 hypothetical protein [Brevibacterium aurantiacum]
MATREESRQKREEKLDELHEKLTGAVEQLVTGEDWADALRFAARFRSRSLANSRSISRDIFRIACLLILNPFAILHRFHIADCHPLGSHASLTSSPRTL